MSLLDYNINSVLFAVLMSIRLGAFFMSVPIFSDIQLSPLIMVILPVGMAFLIAPAISYDVMPIMNSGIIRVGLAVVTEVLVGVIIGFSLNIVTVLATLTGHLSDTNAGMIMASFFDPNMGQVSLLGILLLRLIK